ncbi:hypothetical protein SSYIS1_21020 [Serratia symbiotica]|uniref:Uncharacterized protein n=1 Tax=Serratia symbiotica TaxID=138074 RepID=A0A455VGZ5_9GAMM|nr:hypothetical protein SSYIS1_21020 [Serratia symbiotica]
MTASRSVWIVMALSGWSEKAQLTIFLERESMTITKFNQP